ncbi:hypothetical protein GCM10009839_48520 [Catenulispora yoronensis]|uniref:Uncharacterized protein n=1 Tax=Catenulispora yoronensis TaxID=450799 RepID=A0ABP5G5J1_9ACTN
MTLRTPPRATNLASLIATVALLMALFGGQHAAVLVASASLMALASAVLWCGAVSVLIAGTVQADHFAAAARSSLRDTAFLPQRDPDASGKPRPRAPGLDPATV